MISRAVPSFRKSDINANDLLTGIERSVRCKLRFNELAWLRSGAVQTTLSLQSSTCLKGRSPAPNVKSLFMSATQRHDQRSPPVAYIPEAARLIEALGEEPLRKEFGEAFSMIAAGKLLTNSTAHAKPAAVSQKFPLLLFSHGVNRMAIECTAQAEDLASHGNIIGDIDHVYDSFA